MPPNASLTIFTSSTQVRLLSAAEANFLSYTPLLQYSSWFLLRDAFNAPLLVKETWMRPVLNGVAPCGRNYHTACVVDNRVVIFGGYDGTKMLNDVHNLILDGIELSNYFRQ